ncbi:hypothetical protein HY450_00570 [Candidatus Pacearchaeota archaeon]|nr:hypothetical protein [Candidatus Pacearchaeota archaeon]
MARKVLAALIGNVLGIFSAAQPATQLTQPTTQLVWKQQVEREIRKHDSWVEGYIENDYTNKIEEGHVHLTNLPRKTIDLMAKFGVLGFTGAFNPENDHLLLPDISEKSDEVLDSIDHELWHSIFDSKGKRGLYYDEGFSRPILEEIVAFTKRKVESPEFEKLRDLMKRAEESERVMGFASNISVLIKEYTEQYQLFKKTNEYISENEELKPYISKESQRKIDFTRENVDKQWKPAIDYLLDTNRKLQDLKGRINEEMPLANLVETRKFFTDIYKNLETYEKLGEPIMQYRKTILAEYHSAERKEREEMIKKLQEDLDKLPEGEKLSDEEKEQIQEIIKSLDIDLPVFDAEEINFSLQRMTGGLSRTMRNVTTFSNTYKIDEILGNEDEVMARIVDSLYSLYFGEVTQNKFPLSRADLNFLDRFRMNDVPIFRKGVEKYLVGIELMKQGMSAKEIRGKLEYATSFTFDGREYSWPEANFRIQGTIPEEKIKSEEAQKN